MNRREFFKVSLLPMAAAAIGVPVLGLACVPHFVLLAKDGAVLARSDEVPGNFLKWIQQPHHTVEGARDIQLVYRPDREVIVAHYEFRDCEIAPEFKRRRSLDEPIWLRAGDKLDFTWQFKAQKKSARFGGTL